MVEQISMSYSSGVQIPTAEYSNRERKESQEMFFITLFFSSDSFQIHYSLLSRHSNIPKPSTEYKSSVSSVKYDHL